MPTQPQPPRELCIPQLPPEISAMILDYFPPHQLWGANALYHCSLVSQSWNALSTPRLYAHIKIRNRGMATELIEGGGLGKHKTRCLIFVAWLELNETEKIMTACMGMDCLILNHMTYPAYPFNHPSFAGLKTLILSCRMENHRSNDLVDLVAADSFTLPFQLKRLATSMEYSQLSLLRRIVETSKATLTYLELYPFPAENLCLLNEIAPVIQQLVLPTMYMREALFDMPSSMTAALVEFLPHATSLSYFTLLFHDDTGATHLPPCLSRILDAVSSQLKDLDLWLLPELLSERLLEVLEKAMRQGSPLADLARLRLPEISLADLGGVKRWPELSSLLKKKGVELITKETYIPRQPHV